MKNLFYICNALDDSTRIERGIVTDSPAASRKIFLICQALRKADVHTIVISMGRGRQDGTRRYFQGKVQRVNGIPVIYLPFFHFPVLSELLSLFSVLPILWRLHSLKGIKATLFYNRMPVYFFGLIIARVLQFKTILDLEDGEINTGSWSLSKTKSKIFTSIFDTLCSGGALLACSALENTTKLKPIFCCYGTSEDRATITSPIIFPVNVLLGGTVSAETGAQLLIDAIKILKEEAYLWVKNIQFNISGKGDCISQFETLAKDIRKPNVIMHGRTTDDKYRQMLGRTQVGLALKPNSGVLADTTFPSKVIEFASQGILVVSTDISDVRKVLSDGAIYLTEDNPQLLINKLKWIVENSDAANNLALKGERAIAAKCTPEIVGQMLKDFIFATSKLEKK
jgi:glycosyltransferase involved in cell wall biosynthesis